MSPPPEYHLILARDLSYLNDTEYEQLDKMLIEIKRMLNAFIQKLRTDS
ncbi:MAG: four helix bundle protein [Anaerolineae bacterium]|nr:four helix bundle protein [Anaerolineae bacterium]